MSRIRKKTLKDYQMENQKDWYLMRRRFHADVQKLKAICKTNGWELGQYDLSHADWQCVLSESDYEMDSGMYECSEENENYFLSPEQYNQYKEKYGYEY